MSEPIFYSILRAKAGEVSGIAGLAPKTKPLVRFMFDFPLKPDDQSDASQFTGFLMDLARAWGTELPLYLDLSRFDPDLTTRAGKPLVGQLFEIARQAHLLAVPVAGPVLDRSGKTGAYLKAVARIAARDARGAAIRIPFHDLAVPTDLGRVIDDIQGCIELTDALCDVILDAGPIDALPGGQAAAYDLLLDTFSQASESLALRKFRTLVACSSSIPKKTRSSLENAPLKIPNVEFKVWSEMQNRKALRHVHFGDYGSRFANQTDKKSKARAPARIHLTTSKSHSLYVAPESTYRELAKKAADSEEFLQQRGTWGKFAVRDAGAGRAGVGNSTDWVARDLHTHVETLVPAVAARMREVAGSPEIETESQDSSAYGQQYLPI